MIIIISFYPYNYENIKDIFWKSKLGEIRGVFISILTMIYIIYNYKLQFAYHLTILISVTTALILLCIICITLLCIYLVCVILSCDSCNIIILFVLILIIIFPNPILYDYYVYFLSFKIRLYNIYTPYQKVLDHPKN